MAKKRKSLLSGRINLIVSEEDALTINNKLDELEVKNDSDFYREAILNYYPKTEREEAYKDLENKLLVSEAINQLNLKYRDELSIKDRDLRNKEEIIMRLTSMLDSERKKIDLLENKKSFIDKIKDFFLDK